MKSWEMEEEARKRGFDEGFNDGFNDGFDNATESINQLIILLSEAGRNEDILKAARDKAYQSELLKEFNL